MSVSVERQEQLFQLVPGKPGSTISSTILTTGRYLVGRTESCDVIIPSNIVSSVHAVLEVTPKGIKVYDMNSRNGTYVNGEKAIAIDIKINDKIAFGNVEFTLKKYSSNPDLPPVLDALDPIKGQASVIKKELPKKSPVEIPSKNVEYDKEDDIPYIVYPLSLDPNSDYSEYIFEDEDSLYPIFKYELNKQSVEVIILHQDKVYSVDYLPAKDFNYQIAGWKKTKKQIEFPYLAKEEKVDFIEVHKGNILISKLHNYELLHLTDNKVTQAKSDKVNLQENDIVKLQNGDLEIYVRKVSSPPKVKTPPFFRRDKSLWKYILLMLLLVVLPVIALNLIEIKKEEKDEKDPERIATILYKQKLTNTVSKAIEKTKLEKKKLQQALKKPATKKPEKKPKQAPPVKNSTKDNQKDPGKQTKPKETPKKPEVKPDKGKTGKAGVKGPKTRNPRPPKRSTKAASRAAQRRANNPNKNKGRVDVYKSLDFKSTISTNLAKGGSFSGARTARTATDAVTGANISGGGGIVTTATTNGQGAGALTESATSSISNVSGTKGFSSKRGTYTAGIPSETVVLGSMDPDVIRRILRANIPRFRSCYQRELDRNASNDISGMVRMVFTIGASGHVSRAGVDGNSRLPARVKRCVISVLKGIDFPRPLGGGTVDVKQPFNFYPKRL